MLYSNFRQTLIYTPPTELQELNPARFYITPLTYKTYSMLYLQGLPEDITMPLFPEVILEECVKGSENINPQPTNWFEELPLDVRNNLIEKIQSISIPDKNFYDTLSISVELAINPRFNDESWRCANCQKRKLDLSRNCPFIDTKEHDPVFSLSVAGDTYNVCPMNLQDKQLLRAAFEAKGFRETNCLPEDGGIGNQSVFYVVVSEFVHKAIEHEKNRQEAEAYSKHK